MKAENVLEIYKLIMDEYDKLLSLSLSEIQSTKESLENITTQLVVDTVLLRCQGFTATPDTNSKVWEASSDAFSIAQAKTNDIDDCENYKKTFRQTYEASLRTELYRQFLALGQNKTELLAKLEEGNKCPTTAEFINVIFNEVNTNIDAEVSKFIKIKSALIEPDDKELIDTMIKKLAELTGSFQNSLSPQENSVDTARDIALDFQIKAGRLIRSYQIKTKSDESWAPFLEILLLLLSIIGTIPAILSIRNRVVNGYYSFSFFEEVKFIKTPDNEIAYEDKLLETAAPGSALI